MAVSIGECIAASPAPPDVSAAPYFGADFDTPAATHPLETAVSITSIMDSATSGDLPTVMLAAPGRTSSDEQQQLRLMCAAAGGGAVAAGGAAAAGGGAHRQGAGAAV